MTRLPLVMILGMLITKNCIGGMLRHQAMRNQKIKDGSQPIQWSNQEVYGWEIDKVVARYEHDLEVSAMCTVRTKPKNNPHIGKAKDGENST